MLCGSFTVTGCGDDAASNIVVERLDDVRPALPEVPTLPPPPHPIQYPDGSFSVYGLRQRLNNTIDTEVTVTGYIVDIYTPPECPKGERCPTPTAPHMWIADTTGEQDMRKRLAVAGYAENQAQIDEAVAEARKGRYKPPPPESGLLPVPVDLAVGNKVKVTGQFARVSGSGFNISNGLVDYRSHETTETAGDDS